MAGNIKPKGKTAEPMKHINEHTAKLYEPVSERKKSLDRLMGIIDAAKEKHGDVYHADTHPVDTEHMQSLILAYHYADEAEHAGKPVKEWLSSELDNHCDGLRKRGKGRK